MAIRWSKEHERRCAGILEMLRAEVKPFADDSEEAKAARRGQPFDPWCRTYLPHYFSSASAPAHLLADDLVEEYGMPVFLCWARGFGKSTRFSLAKPLRWILHQERHFVIFGGRTEEVAAEKMSLIRIELRENARIRQDYGPDVAPRAGEDTDTSWVANGVRAWARGAIQQSPRGERHRQYRPDAFVGDDMDDDVISRNPRRVGDLVDWINLAVMPALEGAGAGASVVILGTMYSRGCMMSRAAIRATQKDKDGRALCRYSVFPAVDERGQTTWAERWPQETVDRAEAIMGSAAFRREMRCIEDDSGASFRADWIKPFTAATFPRDRASLAGFCDPSAGSTEQHDYKVWVVGAKLPNDRRVYCLHAWVRNATPMEMLVEGQRIWREFRPGRMGCEANGFQSLFWPLIQAGGFDLPLSSVVNTVSKADRILANIPLFEQGFAVFDLAQGDQKLLVDQFLDYGKTGVHDDGPDAWDGARRLLPVEGAAEFVYRGSAREDRGALFTGVRNREDAWGERLERRRAI